MTLARRCCFVIPLRISCLVIAYVHLVYATLQTILSIFMLSKGVTLSNLNIEDGDKELGYAMIARGAVMLIILLLFIAFSALLVYGLHKEQRGYIRTFLIYGLVFLIIYMLLFFVSLGLGFVGVWNIILGIVEIVVGTYFLLVIRSYYVAMGGSNNRRA